MTTPLRREYHPEQLQYPSQAQIDECTTRTAALFGLGTGTEKKQSEAEVKLKSKIAPGAVQSLIHTSTRTGEQRIIQIHTAAEDPFAMSKFKLKKKVIRPPSPPSTSYVDASLTRTTQEELAKWKIPRIVSNWTNSTRLAQDIGKRAEVERSMAPNTIVNTDTHMALTAALDDTLRRNRDEINARKELQVMTNEAMRELEKSKAETTSLQVQLGLSNNNYDPSTSSSSSHLQPTTKIEHGVYGDNGDGDDGDDNDDPAALLQRARNQQEHELTEKRAIMLEHQQTHQLRRQRDIGEVQTMTGNSGAVNRNVEQSEGNGEMNTIGTGHVDDHVLIHVNKGKKDYIDEEDPYEGEFIDTSKSRAAYRDATGGSGLGVDQDGNVNGSIMGQGALTRIAPVLFQKGHGIVGNNNKDAEQKKENEGDMKPTRDRDRDY